ncbi:MAG: single-stranded-DNA-specific exonuclease RecJ [Patescibacteria group bacterium]
MKNYTVYQGHSPELSSLSPLLQILLSRRGIKDLDIAERFLNPSYERDVHDPFLMKGMEEAVQRILLGISRGERIAVYSDYDADGIPGAVILSDFFKRIKYENFSVYIPHRGDEGYGVHLQAIKSLKKEKVSVIITIDCGTNDAEALTLAKKNGIDVIVADHHLPSHALPPAFAILNTKQDGCSYPEKMLCGAGTVFKLIQGLFLKNNFSLPKGIEKWSLDMVALATLSDVVPLIGENRAFARYGLTVLRRSPRPGLRALLRKIKLSQAHLSEEDVTFMLTPRINAASRMGNPYDAFTLLSTTDELVAQGQADLLHDLNEKRKGVVAVTVKEINERMKHETLKRKIIVMGSPSWKPSLLGLVATKISEEENVPVFLWGREENEIIRGSCRSDGNINVVVLMDSTKNVFTRFGGHRLAGGFTVSADGIHIIESELLKAHAALSEESLSKPTPIIDARLLLGDIDWGLYKMIDLLSPFGLENPKPLFLFENVHIEEVKHFGKKEKVHLSLSLSDGKGKQISGISFFTSLDDLSFPPLSGMRANVVGHVEKSVFRGFPELRLRIVDVLPIS